MLIPRLLAKGLTRVLTAARKNPIPLNGSHRFVIFSDHHKGANTEADDFRHSKPAYLRALDYYHTNDYHLVILGDSEELWEEPIERVLDAHGDVLQSEKRFHDQNRYLRIFGNHDSNWASRRQVAKHLHPIFPGLEVTEGLLFTYMGAEPESSGELFLVHGHQGTLDSEFFAPISRIIVRGVWRTLQILFKYAGTTPAKDANLRGKHDTLMYQWAAAQGKLILLAGHTHRTIWTSQTKLEQKLVELRALQLANELVSIPDYAARRAALFVEIGTLQKEEPLANDALKTRYCYFNDGCCSYDDASVTAYELEDGELRLVHWDRNASTPQVTNRSQLGDIFSAL